MIPALFWISKSLPKLIGEFSSRVVGLLLQISMRHFGYTISNSFRFYCRFFWALCCRNCHDRLPFRWGRAADNRAFVIIKITFNYIYFMPKTTNAPAPAPNFRSSIVWKNNERLDSIWPHVFVVSELSKACGKFISNIYDWLLLYCVFFCTFLLTNFHGNGIDRQSKQLQQNGRWQASLLLLSGFYWASPFTFYLSPQPLPTFSIVFSRICNAIAACLCKHNTLSVWVIYLLLQKCIENSDFSWLLSERIENQRAHFSGPYFWQQRPSP